LFELRERKWVARNAQEPVIFPPIIAKMKESYQRQISMSQGVSGRDGDRGEFYNLQRLGPDSWAVVGSNPVPPLPPPKAGDLSNFGKISKTQPMTLGPSNVFVEKKGAENEREAISQTNSINLAAAMLRSAS
jgi:translation initiation factor 4G